MQTGNAIDGRDLAINRIGSALIGKLADPNPRRVTMSLVRQSPHENPFATNRISVGASVVIVLSPDHICIEPCSTDVLSDLINNKQVGDRERQPGQPLGRQLEKLLFAFKKPCGGDRFDQGGFIIGILNNRQTADDATLGNHGSRNRSNDFHKTVISNGSMINLGPFVLTETDQHHFVKPRFDVADKARMRLHSTDN